MKGTLTSRLHSSDSHEEGGTVPTNFIETLELVGDFGNGSGHNGLE